MAQLTGTLSASLNSFAYSASKDFADALQQFTAGTSTKLTSGTGVNQANLMYSKVITLAASATISIDLNGVVNDALGQNVTMVSVVAIYVANRDMNNVDSVGTLTLGGGANAVSGLVATGVLTRKLSPGEVLLNFCGNAGGLCSVTPGTADILQIANSGAGSSTFQIIIIGRDA